MRGMRFWAGLVVGLRLDCAHRPDCYPMGPAPDGVVSICRLTCLSHEFLLVGGEWILSLISI